MPAFPRRPIRRTTFLAPLALAVLVVGGVFFAITSIRPSPGQDEVIQAPSASLPDDSSRDSAQVQPINITNLQNPPILMTPVLTPLPTATPTPNPIPEIPETAEQAAVRSLLNGEAGVYGFVLLDAAGNTLASYNGFTPFVTASTYKVVLMADIYRRIENGELSLDQQVYLDPAIFNELGGDNYFDPSMAGSYMPIEALLYDVGVYSSNASALTLLTLTTPDDLNQTARSIGMMRTCLFCDPYSMWYWPPEPGIDSSDADMQQALDYISREAKLGPVNITTPYDMAVYNLGLVNDTVVSPWVSEQIVGILQYQAIRDRLPVYNQGVFMIDKPGNLVGVVNDVGVLYLPGGARAVAALSINVPDDVHATKIIQLLGLIANGTTDIS